MTEQYCPKCKSKNLIKKITLSAVWGFPQKNKCLNCGFESYMYAKKINNKNKKVNIKRKTKK